MTITIFGESARGTNITTVWRDVKRIRGGDVNTTPIPTVPFLEIPMPSTEATGPVTTVDVTATGGAAVLFERQKKSHLYLTYQFKTQNAFSINLLRTYIL